MSVLQCPDHSTLVVDRRTVLGRGTSGSGSISDTAASREQFAVSPVEGLPGVLRLEALGHNAAVVERWVAATGEWAAVELLEQGQCTVLEAPSRFYVASRKDTTTFTVTDSEAQPAAQTGNISRKRPASPAPQGPGGVDQQLPAKQHRPSPARTCADLEYAPVKLLRVRGIPDWANQGVLGARLRDVVRGDMCWVLASNYMVDLGWLLSACPDLARVPHLVIAHGERSANRIGAMKADAATAGITDCVVHAPPLPIQWGTYHSKAFIIAYDRGVRVVVHTANLIYVDCNNKTQAIWWQDFPPKDADSPSTSDFESELTDYLEALKLPTAAAARARQLCAQHDFSSARAHLLVSCPGYHTGRALHRFGHMRVRALLNRETFPATFKGSPIAAQFSSLGSLDERWLAEFSASLSAGGISGGQRLGPPAPGAKGLQLVWPTVEEIRNSVEGWSAGTSVPGPHKNVSKPFLQPYWHRYGGAPVGRQRAMPHIKTYTRYVGNELAWLIVASHNLSKAAWGALQKGGQQLMIRSYELGVLLLPSGEGMYWAHRHRGYNAETGACAFAAPMVEAPSSSSAAPSVQLRSVGGHSQPLGAQAPGESKFVNVPLPYQLPPEPYQQHDKPWAVDVEWPGRDALGLDIHGGGASFYGRVEPAD